MRTVRSFANEHGEAKHYSEKLKVTFRLRRRGAWLFAGYMMTNQVRLLCSFLCFCFVFCSEFYYCWETERIYEIKWPKLVSICRHCLARASERVFTWRTSFRTAWCKSVLRHCQEMARRSIVLSNGGLGGMSLPLFDLPFGWKSFIQRGAGYRVPDEKIFSSDTGGQDSRTIQQRKFTIYFASKKINNTKSQCI